MRRPHAPFRSFHRRPAVPALIAAVASLSFAACSGSSESATDTTEAGDTAESSDAASASSTTISTTTSTTTPPTSTTTTPSTTTTTTTSSTTTSTTSTTTAPTTTSTVPVDTAETAAFCAASSEAFVADAITDEPADERANIVAALDYLTRTIDASVATAPEGAGSDPQEAAVLVRQLAAIFAEHDYDITAIQESGAEDELVEIILPYEEVMSRLTEFLTVGCGADIGVLADAGAKLAPIIAEANSWPMVPLADGPTGIHMWVPDDWSETEDLDDAGGEVAAVRAAPDLVAYSDTWTTPGVAVVAFYVEAGTADAAARLAISLAPQCTEVSVEPYDDGFYVGLLGRYEMCDGTDTAVEVLTATDSSEAIEIVAEFQLPAGTDRIIVDRMLATLAVG